jgi:hypothetical protein
MAESLSTCIDGICVNHCHLDYGGEVLACSIIIKIVHTDRIGDGIGARRGTSTSGYSMMDNASCTDTAIYR